MLSTLNVALLGLLGMQPMSGYALRKVFAGTPLGIYSSSPGAIYPALKKLSRLELVSRTTRMGKTRRPTETFSLTLTGTEALERALTAPIMSDDIARRMPELMLRFAMMDGTLTPVRIASFLVELERAVNAHVAALKKFKRLNDARFLPCGRLAFEIGIQDYENRALWARRARARLPSLRRKKGDPHVGP